MFSPVSLAVAASNGGHHPQGNQYLSVGGRHWRRPLQAGGSERHTDIKIKTSRACVVEVVVANVRQANVIAQSKIEHVETGTAADAQSSVETLEGSVIVTET